MKNDGFPSAERVRSLARSFKFAARGAVYCIRNERNMRIHLTAGAYVLTLSSFCSFTRTELLILILTIALVIFAEGVNTALEALVNLETQSYDSLARVAKDVAAGAVLFCAIAAVAVGVILFVIPGKLQIIACALLANPLYGIIFLLSIPLAVSFIVGVPKKLFRRL